MMCSVRGWTGNVLASIVCVPEPRESHASSTKVCRWGIELCSPGPTSLNPPMSTAPWSEDSRSSILYSENAGPPYIGRKPFGKEVPSHQACVHGRGAPAHLRWIVYDSVSSFGAQTHGEKIRAPVQP